MSFSKPYPNYFSIIFSKKNTSLLLLCVFWSVLCGQQAIPRSIFNYLTDKETRKITLELDLTHLIINRKTNDFFPASLSADDGSTLKIEVRPRGKFRRKHCELPPLKLKFSKKDLRNKGFADSLNEIKLLVPCFFDRRGEELLLKEYLAYRIFEHLTPVSFRARLVRLTLRDNHVEKSYPPVWALLLEDKEELCARHHCREVEKFGIETDSLHTQHTALMVMFQYMIGNTDWDISMIRNVQLIMPRQGEKAFAVPYDFDFSGLVSAPYSSPNSETGLLTVRDRYLMSSGLRTESLRRATRTLIAAKKDIVSICRNKLLSRQQQDEVVEYLETFFQAAESSLELPVMLKHHFRLD